MSDVRKPNDRRFGDYGSTLNKKDTAFLQLSNPKSNSNRKKTKIKPQKDKSWNNICSEAKLCYNNLLYEHINSLLESWKSITSAYLKFYSTKSARQVLQREESIKKLYIISQNISQCVRQFWKNIETLVVERKKVQLEADLRKAAEFEQKRLFENAAVYSKKISEDPLMIKTSVTPNFRFSGDLEKEPDDDEVDIRPEWKEQEKRDALYDNELSSGSESSEDMLKFLQEESELDLEELKRRFNIDDTYNSMKFDDVMNNNNSSKSTRNRLPESKPTKSEILNSNKNHELPGDKCKQEMSVKRQKIDQYTSNDIELSFKPGKQKTETHSSPDDYTLRKSKKRVLGPYKGSREKNISRLLDDHVTALSNSESSQGNLDEASEESSNYSAKESSDYDSNIKSNIKHEINKASNNTKPVTIIKSGQSRSILKQSKNINKDNKSHTDDPSRAKLATNKSQRRSSSSQKKTDETGTSSNVKIKRRNSHVTRIKVENDYISSANKVQKSRCKNEITYIKDTTSNCIKAEKRDKEQSSTNAETVEVQRGKCPVPFLLRATLREYQHEGLTWLLTLHDNEAGGILADEMGLGKTIQTIALFAYLACYRGIWGPHLVVVPSSVLLNWETEFHRFFPGFRILTYYGSRREREKKRQGWTEAFAFNVCLVSYALVVADAHVFKRKAWYYLVLDEAQNIKNFRSQKWQTLLNFNSQRRLLLTGTPLQNDLTELWALVHFLMQNLFESHQEWKEMFSNPLAQAIEFSQIESEQKLTIQLHEILRPFILRRLKREVEAQMPSKYEHTIKCFLTRRQRLLYDEFIKSKNVQSTLINSDYFQMLNVLMQLQKICNHPDLLMPREPETPFCSVIRPVIKIPSWMDLNRYRDWSKADFSCLSWNALSYQNLSRIDFEKEITLTAVKRIREPSPLPNINECVAYGLSNPYQLDSFYTTKPPFVSNRFSRIQMKELLPLPQYMTLAIIPSVEFLLHPANLNNSKSNNWITRVRKFVKLSNTRTSETSILKKIILNNATSIQANPCETVAPEAKLAAQYSHVAATIVSVLRRSAALEIILTSGLKPDPLRISKMPTKMFPKYFKCQQDFLNPNFRNYLRNHIYENLYQYHKMLPKTHQSTHYESLVSNSAFRNLIPCSIDQIREKLEPVLQNLLICISVYNALPFGPRLKYLNGDLLSSDELSQYEPYDTATKILQEATYPFDIVDAAQKCLIPPKSSIQHDCGKLKVLAKLLHQLQREGHKCIIFTQMSRVLNILEQFANLHSFTYLRLDGSTKIALRQKLIEKFNEDPKIFIFIASTRAGGIGINLTGADTVIFYDTDWNPAMERQAMDRCHRIGQTRDVHVYRLITEATIEENILRKQLYKRILNDLVVDQGNFTTNQLFKNLDEVGVRELITTNIDADDLYITRILHESTSSMLDPVDERFENAIKLVEDAEDQTPTEIFNDSDTEIFLDKVKPDSILEISHSTNYDSLAKSLESSSKLETPKFDNIPFWVKHSLYNVTKPITINGSKTIFVAHIVDYALKFLEFNIPESVNQDLFQLTERLNHYKSKLVY